MRIYFCPNYRCEYYQHPASDDQWYVRNGSYHNRIRGRVQRYRCTRCNHGFSDMSFSIDFMAKKRVPYRYLFLQLKSAAGIRSIARDLKVSHKTILNRCSRLARQAMAIHSALVSEISCKEDLVTDGFESFVLSQYFPNNIHLLVGKHSQYLYTFNYAHLRRKGRMREEQKIRRAKLDEQWKSGKRTISSSFGAIVSEVEQLVRKSEVDKTVLYSDEKWEYARVIGKSRYLERRRREGSFTHVRISSKRARTRQNRLFSVNYLERQIRKDNANHVREGVRITFRKAGIKEINSDAVNNWGCCQTGWNLQQLLLRVIIPVSGRRRCREKRKKEASYSIP